MSVDDDESRRTSVSCLGRESKNRYYFPALDIWLSAIGEESQNSPSVVEKEENVFLLIPLLHY